MAGTVTVTQAPLVSKYGKEIQKISVVWTSDASGNADGAINQLYGYILKAITNPTDGPTDNYNVTLVDENGIDALAGALAGRDTANTEQVYPVASGAATPIFVAGDHTFTVAGAGNAKSGVCVFYVVECL